MKFFREIPSVVKEVTSITCDVCKTTYDDPLDLQEFHSFTFIGGYNSYWGDGTWVSGDVCDKCFWNTFKNNFMKMEYEDFFDE